MIARSARRALHGVALATAILLSACHGAGDADHVQPSEACQQVLTYAQATWSPGVKRTHGFGEPMNLLQTSEYQTAWNTRLQLDLDASHRNDAETTIPKLLSPPEGETDLGRPLQRVLQAAAIRHEAGEHSFDRAILARLEKFKTRNGFAWQPGGRTTPDSTMLGIAAERWMGMPLDNSRGLANWERLVLLEKLPADELRERGVAPIVIASALHPDSGHRETLERLVRRWHDSVLAEEANAVSIADLYWIHTAAEWLGVDLTPVPPEWLDPLKTEGGYLVGPLGDAPDPQTTYYGVVVVPGPREGLSTSLERHSTPNGWYEWISEPDLGATVRIIGALDACGIADSFEHPTDVIPSGDASLFSGRKRLQACAVIRAMDWRKARDRCSDAEVSAANARWPDTVFGVLDREEPDRRAAVSEFCDDDGLCRVSVDATPDIVSTAMGAIIRGDSAPERAELLARFGAKGFFRTNLDDHEPHADSLTMLGAALLDSGDSDDLYWLKIL